MRFFNAWVSGWAGGGAVVSVYDGNAWLSLTLVLLSVINAYFALRKGN